MKITYIFSGNRKEKFILDQIEAKDFYYGLTELDKKNHKITLIEFHKKNTPLYFFLKILDKFFQKILSLPVYSANLFSLKNISLIIKSNKVFLISESVGCSAFLLILISKIFSKPEVSLFVMGLYSKNLRFKSLKYFHNLYIKFMYSVFDNFLFLSKGELSKAKKIHKKFNKLSYFPFSTDVEFWSNDNNKDLFQNENIIFVGNDGNRNSDLTIKIATSLKKYNFTIVSSIPELQNLNLENVKVFKGIQGSKEITDAKLKEIYLNSKISIIPLKESTQPSGQSVALQCMSLGIPVVITKTEGFWDKDIFKNFYNIIFIEINNVDEWSKIIQEIYYNSELLNYISNNAKKTVQENFSINNFKFRLEKYLN